MVAASICEESGNGAVGQIFPARRPSSEESPFKESVFQSGAGVNLES